MKAHELYKEYFKPEKLVSLYNEKIRVGASPGTDGITYNKFDKELLYNIHTVLRKVDNCSYNFSPYKSSLISKGPDKKPRKIAKPTIRDRVVLRVLYEILNNLYHKELSKRTLHSQIKKAIEVYLDKKYDHILKYDITEFFPSIDHDIITKVLNKRIKKKQLLCLINSLLKTPHDIDKAKGNTKANMGIAQGLAVSSTIANIYLISFDKVMEVIQGIEYFRYVDDILIFCKAGDAEKIHTKILNELSLLKLSVHNEKCKDIPVNEAFDFLGYTFYDYNIAVRKSSVQKLLDGIIRILALNKYKNGEYLEKTIFRINSRITGCVKNGKRYGWLFYFSQISNVKLLYAIDHNILKQVKRYGIDEKRIKSITKAWFCLLFQYKKLNYIPNYDNYSKEQKKEVIKIYYPKKKIDASDIDYFFEKIINHEIKDLERDMSNRS
jgi:RNA-directed DNA polymerase